MHTESSAAPSSGEWLICFCDLNRFGEITEKVGDSGALFRLFDGMARVMIERLSSGSGRVVKFIGDAALIVFPAAAADEGVGRLMELKSAIEHYFATNGFPTTMTFNIHLGEATTGPFGVAPLRTFEIYGAAVNETTLLRPRGIDGDVVLSQAVYERLGDDARARFVLHEVAGVYVARDG